MTHDPDYWTASTSELLAALQGRLSARQVRLIACACVAPLTRAMGASAAQAIEVAHRFADRKATAHELAAARYAGRFIPGHPAWAVCWGPEQDPIGMLERAMSWVVGIDPTTTYFAYSGARLPAHADVIREVASGIVFTPALEPSWLAWNDATVMKLAHSIYDANDFAQMPILGDALEEAGCETERLLRHCREDQHVRGCWLLDAVLGLR